MTFEEQIRDAIKSIRAEGEQNVHLVDLLDQEIQNAEERVIERVKLMMQKRETRRSELIRHIVGVAISAEAGTIEVNSSYSLGTGDSNIHQLPHHETTTSTYADVTDPDPLMIYSKG